MFGSLAYAGQWYRLFFRLPSCRSQAPVMNVIALGKAGYALGRIVGHAWVVCIRRVRPMDFWGLEQARLSAGRDAAATGGTMPAAAA
jgi:hypothetical protein